MVSSIGFKTMEDPTQPPTTMEAPLCLQLIQQMIKLQRENIELYKEGTYDWPSKNSSVQKPERPTIELDSSNGDWALFMDTWGWYKEIRLLKNPALIWNELGVACTLELNRLLFGLQGAETVNSVTAEQSLQYIRLVAVRGLHKVHQQNFHLMIQKRESIMYFVARLQNLEKFSEFFVICLNKPNCGWHIDYSSNWWLDKWWQVWPT